MYQFFLVKLGGYFWLVYFVFSLVLVGIQGLILVFLPISQLLQLTESSLAVLLTFFRSFIELGQI